MEKPDTLEVVPDVLGYVLDQPGVLDCGGLMACCDVGREVASESPRSERQRSDVRLTQPLQ